MLNGKRIEPGFCVVSAALMVATAASAQTTANAPATMPADDALISLNLPENAPLKVLIDYISQEFGFNILYDDQVANQRITIVAPAKLPRSAALALLDSTLRMKGLALTDAGQPGWKRIVALQQAARMSGGDQKDATVITQIFKLKYADATKLDPLVKPFLTQPGASSLPLADQQLLVVTDYAGNLKRVADLVQSIDQPNQDVGIEFFALKHADPARVTQQLGQLLKAKLHSEGGDDRLANTVETSYDARTNQVVVIAPKSRMNDARDVVRALDISIPETQSPIRFYKLANATAADVLTTIRSLEGDDQTPAPSAAGAPSQNPTRNPARTDPAAATPANGSPLASRQLNGPGTAGGNGGLNSAAAPATPRAPAPTGANDPMPPLREAVKTGQAKVTADPNTNSILVIAPPDVQLLYEQLIRTLDKRRPQVLIECTIVSLDTTNNFQYGVEIGTRGAFGSNQFLNFSSFGLSTPNPNTGQLAIVPGLGFNGALLSSDAASTVVHALQQNSRARVTSAPRILVNDNNLGTLSTVSEFPYASVNASQTVATTSFGDYVQAGTTITVTPHISESDYLQLEYSVLLSSFTGTAITQNGTTLPPPRQSNSVQSEVTIPDGSTIIVGGLNSRNFSKSKDAIPILGNIPLLGDLFFSNHNNADTITTLFVFIRPVILRDDKFADLKFLSEGQTRAARVPPDFPTSEPLTIR